MELRVLEYFLAVAREENITRAARQLHITQPTLSRQIARLEEELGVKLFERDSHGIQLTAGGLLLKRRALELLSLADKTKADLAGGREDISGTVSIGSGEFMSTSCLAQIIAAFGKRHPAVKYEIYSGNAGNISDYIERGLLDPGLMSRPVDMRKYSFVTMPGTEQWGAYLPVDSELAGKSVITPRDLAGRRIISATGDFNRSRIARWLGRYRDAVEIAASANLPYNEAVLAQENIGVMLSIKLKVSYENLRFVPLEPEMSIHTALAWKKERFFSRAASRFISFATQYLKSISDDKL